VQTVLAGYDSPLHEPGVAAARPRSVSPVMPVDLPGGFMNRIFVTGQGFHRNHIEVDIYIFIL